MSARAVRAAVAEQVERDDAVAALGERLRELGVHALVEQQAVHQHGHARALAVGGVGEPVAAQLERALDGMGHRGRSVRSARPYRPRFDARHLPPDARGRPRAPSSTSTGARSTTSTAAAAPPTAAPTPTAALLRYRRLLDADPGGAWVAERDGRGRRRRAGAAARGPLGPVAARRRPARPGRRRRPRAAARWLRLRRRRARPRDPLLLGPAGDARLRAARARAAPRLAATRRAAGVAAPPEVRAGRPGRPAAHRGGRPRASAAPPTARTSSRCSTGGHELLVPPERGYAMLRAAPGPAAAPRSTTTAPATVLRGALARIAERGESADVEFLTAPPAVGDRRLPRGRAGPARPTAAACSPAATSARSRPTFPAGRTCSVDTSSPEEERTHHGQATALAERQDRRRHGRRQRHRTGRSREALIAKGARVAIGDVDREAAERTAAELGDARRRAAARRHRPRRLHRLPRRRRAPPRADRHPRQQRRDHADHAARGRSRRRASRASSRSTCAR